jgi:hypothetical protein
MEKFVFPMSFRRSHVSSVHKSHGISLGSVGSNQGTSKTYMVYCSSPTAPAYEGNAGAM